MPNSLPTAAATPASGSRPVRQRRTALGRLLARIFPSQTFAGPLEGQFRRWYSDNVRARIRSVVWLPLASLLIAVLAGGPFGELRAALKSGS